VVAPAIAGADDLVLESTVSRRETGRDLGEALGGDLLGVTLESDIEPPGVLPAPAGSPPVRC
jgi:hypothetical protein